MSLAAALSNAASGLAAVSRSTDIVSANVANATTPGYGRRVAVQAATPDGGVRIASVERIVSASILADHRNAAAAVGAAGTIAAFHTGMEKALGLDIEGGALTDRVATLEAALTAATSRPDNPLRLEAAVRAAGDLVAGITTAAASVAEARTEADRAIAGDVRALTQALGDVARLNRSIIIEEANGRSAAALLDERQRVIDGVASIVPIREVPRPNGRIALFTEGGAMLLDGDSPVDLGFQPAGQVTPQMAGAPPLSRLSVGGEQIGGRLMALFSGGSLEAHFRVRDELGPAAQAGLDALALDLSQRFADPALDPTLVPGEPGLFTDGGALASPAAALGLAGRLALAPSLEVPGSAWRLRDGIGAAVPGPEGASALVSRLAERLGEARTSASTAMPPGQRSVAGFVAELSAKVSTERVAAQVAAAATGVRADSLQSALLAAGVDTDHEMQRLLELQQAYSANAKVIMAVDAMLSRILEI
ncbi:flagellar hook-associated protein FlgK [Paracoccus sp. S-4012]|uniref:flagellar hook-associated protein FlgK n=1 Tax=Paracoccus sp. S-4012 TaxID=2665648 RepID=UPI0012B0F891|nr:flagellar hook-associated protein FlgK [Paracoccus sp. S-4012]MRX49807.1 flagellar hook-associated protein FlgK [Paracoccus sp. S-4012]